jgi:hypothetical protein
MKRIKLSEKELDQLWNHVRIDHKIRKDTLAVVAEQGDDYGMDLDWFKQRLRQDNVLLDKLSSKKKRRNRKNVS